MGRKLFLCALALWLGAGYLAAQTVEGLSGRSMTLTLLSAVTSRQKSGSPFEAQLERPLEVDGKVLLPQGTILAGKLATRHARRLYRAGSLRFVFESLRLPDGRTSRVDLSLRTIQADPNGHARLAARIDEEGGVHPHFSKKKLLLNIGLTLAVGKVADDASETIIRSLSVAGARYFAFGSGAAFLLLRSKGASVKLPQGTRLEVVFQRNPWFQSPLTILPLAGHCEDLVALDNYTP